MYTKASISTLALGLIKNKSSVTNFDTDTGTLADKVRLFYPESVRLAVADYNFNFAVKTVTLTESVGPTIILPYTAAFLIPPDYIRIAQEMPCGIGAYEWSSYNGDRVLHTQANPVVLKYVCDLSENPSLFPVNFMMGVAHFLGALLSPQVTGTKSSKSRDAEATLYNKAAGWIAGQKKLDAIERGYRQHEDTWPES